VVLTSAEQSSASESSKRGVEAVGGERRGEWDSSPPSHPRTKQGSASEGSKGVEAVDGGRRVEGDSSPHTPSHPRTKSLARRRPREKRRSTGIVLEVHVQILT